MGYPSVDRKKYFTEYAPMILKTGEVRVIVPLYELGRSKVENSRYK